MAGFAIVVHGGAGGAPRSTERVERLRAGAAAAIEAGHAVLVAGGRAVDAVQAAVLVLEDDPAYNAGRGAALTDDGGVELDAAVMEGTGRRAGAVAALRGVRNPVLAARAVMEEGREVLLVGAAAASLARSAGLELCPEEWFLARDEPARSTAGTVGAVARDRDGRLAAATSTGGKPGQRTGRVGDTPVIGAGTWADDATVAVSCTGDGEASIRVAMAHEVQALVEHAGRSLEEACAAALATMGRFGGDGGLIAVGADGAVAAPFTSPAMTRGWKVADGPIHTAVGPDDG